jgi:hypothetical protein
MGRCQEETQRGNSEREPAAAFLIDDKANIDRISENMRQQKKEEEEEEKKTKSKR